MKTRILIPIGYKHYNRYVVFNRIQDHFMHLQSYIKNIRKEGKRCFTIKNVVEQFRVSCNHARVAICRLLKAGDIISSARGLYVIVPPENQPHGSMPAEELVPLIMQYVGANYYVSLLTAGLFHGATHQKPAKFQVISDKRMKHPLVFGDVAIDFIYKKSIFGLPTKDFIVGTGYLKVATPELVMLDLLNYPNHAGGLNHIATVYAELIENLDRLKLIQLANDTDTAYQLQRIGYILDHIEVMDEKNAAMITHVLELYIKESKPNYLSLASEISKVSYIWL